MWKDVKSYQIILFFFFFDEGYKYVCHFMDTMNTGMLTFVNMWEDIVVVEVLVKFVKVCIQII